MTTELDENTNQNQTRRPLKMRHYYYCNRRVYMDIIKHGLIPLIIQKNNNNIYFILGIWLTRG